ncbi:HNH endonuclease [Acidithiobacillus sp.]
MTICLYHRDTATEVNDFTLEHIIPDPLGGRLAPDWLKLRNVCKQCNNNIGHFVDASFTHSWFVAQLLHKISHRINSNTPHASIPLNPLGLSGHRPSYMENDETCEAWLGPHGELVFWIRPTDERFVTYMGGNPRTTRTTQSRAYFFPNTQSENDIEKMLNSFRDALPKKLVKKVIFGQWGNVAPEAYGFSEPDALDRSRLEFFNSRISVNMTDQITIPIGQEFDWRFLAKLAIGIGYTTYGDHYLSSPYYQSLKNGLWHWHGVESPRIHGMSFFTPSDIANDSSNLFTQSTGIRNAVTILIKPQGTSLAVLLNIDKERFWVVQASDFVGLDPQIAFSKYGEGLAVILCKEKSLMCEVGLPDLLAHFLGLKRQHIISQIEA